MSTWGVDPTYSAPGTIQVHSQVPTFWFGVCSCIGIPTGWLSFHRADIDERLGIVGFTPWPCGVPGFRPSFTNPFQESSYRGIQREYSFAGTTRKDSAYFVSAWPVYEQAALANGTKSYSAEQWQLHPEGLAGSENYPAGTSFQLQWVGAISPTALLDAPISLPYGPRNIVYDSTIRCEDLMTAAINATIIFNVPAPDRRYVTDWVYFSDTSGIDFSKNPDSDAPGIPLVFPAGFAASYNSPGGCRWENGSLTWTDSESSFEADLVVYRYMALYDGWGTPLNYAAYGRNPPIQRIVLGRYKGSIKLSQKFTWNDSVTEAAALVTAFDFSDKPVRYNGYQYTLVWYVTRFFVRIQDGTIVEVTDNIGTGKSFPAPAWPSGIGDLLAANGYYEAASGRFVAVAGLRMKYAKRDYGFNQNGYDANGEYPMGSYGDFYLNTAPTLAGNNGPNRKLFTVPWNVESLFLPGDVPGIGMLVSALPP